MNEVMVFENDEFGKVRTVEIDGKAWFSAKDVAMALGYHNPQKAVKDHVFAEDLKMGERGVTPSVTDKLGRLQYPSWINMSGVYALIFSSQLKTAINFKHWVTSEVLPSIQETGSYSIQTYPQPDYKLPMNYHDALVQLVEQVELNEQLVAENKVLTPKAEYCDDVLKKDGLLTPTVIAKDLGMNARKLNQIMHDCGIIYKSSSGIWHPYKAYEWLIEKGYADYRSYTEERAKPQLQWTEKGRKWIVENIGDWKRKLREALEDNNEDMDW